MVNYDKWDSVEASDDEDDVRAAVPSQVAHLVPAGAQTLPIETAKMFLKNLCATFFAHMDHGEGLEICCTALRSHLPGVKPLAAELKENVAVTSFAFPECLPERWRRGQEQLLLAGEQSSHACIAAILQDLRLGMLTRERLFESCGNAPGSAGHAQLEERLMLPPGHFLLVVLLQLPDGTGWVETRQLPFNRIETRPPPSVELMEG